MIFDGAQRSVAKNLLLVEAKGRAVILIARTLLRPADFSSCQHCLRVLRAQKSLNTEVREILRALCVRALEARSTQRVSFWLRPTAALLH